MKKLKKALLYTVIFIVLAMVIALSYVTLALPDVGKPENISIVITPQRIARGEYLANHVSLCMDCHSQRDWSKPIGPIASDKLGAGGDDFDKTLGFPGDVYVPNITPYKLKSWTDGEIFRAITTGERKDGSAIHPFMPWGHFSTMSREDLYSIIAYLRSIKPIKTGPYPDRKLDFPQNILVNTMPQKASLGELPSKGDTVSYGAYLINAAACGWCHSKDNNFTVISGMEYAGGKEFKVGSKSQISANITPDKTTGIGNWTSEAFVDFFKSHTDSARLVNKSSTSEPGVMPFYDYSGMSASDLKAIYAYLRTIKPVNNKVVNN